MECSHTHEVVLTWIGHNDEQRKVKACECCAAMIWNRLPQPLRESFTIDMIEPS